MSDPFLIEGPAVVSFSGGRTSGYMLRRMLDAGLRPDVYVLFANTGKEREETLAFVAQATVRWKVPIYWLERREAGRYVEVDFATASRDGEPFQQLIEERHYLPNPRARFCTQELKIETFRWFMQKRGYDAWSNVVGFRADERRRVARTRQREAEDPCAWASVFPLDDAGVTKSTIEDFWRRSPFDLALGPHEGNCDLCFLKGVTIRRSLMRERPGSADWWIDQERAIGATFRSKASPSYAQIASHRALPMYAPEDDLTDMECFCHD